MEITLDRRSTSPAEPGTDRPRSYVSPERAFARARKLSFTMAAVLSIVTACGVMAVLVGQPDRPPARIAAAP